jgi:hypothetical protein
MEPVFTLQWPEFVIAQRLQTLLPRKDGYSVLVPLSRQEKGIDLAVLHRTGTGTSVTTTIQVKASRTYLSPLPAVRWGSARGLAGEDRAVDLASTQLSPSDFHPAGSVVRLDSRQSSSSVRSAVPGFLASLGREPAEDAAIPTSGAARAAHLEPAAGAASAHSRFGSRRGAFARRRAMDQQPPPDATASPETVPSRQHRVGRRSSSEASTPIPRSTRRCITFMHTPTTPTRSRNMDSNVKRLGWEICGRTGRGPSNLLKGPYRPGSQQTDGRFLEFFATPHQAEAPRFRADLENRANHANPWRLSGPFSYVSNPASLPPCLTRVAEIG